MENSLASWLEAIFIPAITGFGLIGNTLTFIMLTRKPPRPRWIAPIMRYRASRPQPPSSPLDNPPFTESDTQSSSSQRPSTKQGHSSSVFNISSSPSRNASPPAQLTASSSDKNHSPASQPSSSTPKDATYLPPLTTRFLLKALAIVDSLILLWPCFIQWTVRLSSGSSIFDRSDAFCKIGTFFNYFLLQLSPWLLVLVTIDRVYNIAFPTFSLKTPLTQTHVKRLFIVTILILALLNSYMLFGLNLRLEKEMSNTSYENATNASSSQSDWECYPKDSFKYFVISVWSWIDFAVAFGLPFVIIVLGNVRTFSGK
ncbi:uncharacterized protein LOC128223137 [Mya arenaria]|uniref:uncharacterized protein LOC128223137 n=1 Tax=Mya arenaria TaxID=6604 RepID=UPI0022E1BC4D|nr:uncharacterized protein LOC128223137 [Mya arenaria]XP_052788379.1 uncharacterized protein LOC128223137 [Mya arenaria]XP_052788380.1 uncharacterized protein LOC128223137 [Mya arenaria]